MSANFAELMKDVKSSLTNLERTRWTEDPSLPGQLGKALVRIDGLTAENVDYRGKLKKQKAENEDLKKQLEALKKNENEHRRNISFLQSNCDLWKEKYTTNLDYMTVAHNSTMILEKKCAEKDEMLEKLKAQEARTVEHYKAILSYKDMEVDELNIQLKDSEEKVASLTQDFTILESNSQEWSLCLSNQLEDIQRKMKSMEEELNDKTTDLADARTELGLQNNQLHDQTDEIRKQKAEIEKMKEEMDEYKETMEKLHEENERLYASGNKSGLSDYIEDLEHTMKKLRAELANKNAILAKAKKELDVFQEQDTFQSQHERKNEEIEALRKQLDASKQVEFKLINELNKVQKELKSTDHKHLMDLQLIRELKKQIEAMSKDPEDEEPEPQDMNLKKLDYEALKKDFSEGLDKDVKTINQKFVHEMHKKITEALESTMGPTEPKVGGASEEPSTSENWWHKDYVTDSSDNWEDCSSENEEEEDSDESDAWSREANA